MRVLIIGLGSIAKKHINALHHIEEKAQIYALRRPDSNIEAINGIINIADPIKEVDFAIISNPTSEHAKAIEKLIDFNIPLFIEKPLFDKLSYSSLIDEINKRNISTYIACNLRFLECIQVIKNALVGKRINEVNIYCGSYLPDWRPNVDYRKVYSANKELGGGVHIDLIHEIDYMKYLFGFPNHCIKTFSNKSSLNITAYDYANYLFEYRDFCVNIVLNYFRRTPKRSIEVVCDDGEYEVDLIKNEIYWNKKLIYTSECDVQDTYQTQMRYFLNNILKDGMEDKMNDINEAYQILKLCLED